MSTSGPWGGLELGVSAVTVFPRRCWDGLVVEAMATALNDLRELLVDFCSDGVVLVLLVGTLDPLDSLDLDTLDSLGSDSLVPLDLDTWDLRVALAGGWVVSGVCLRFLAWDRVW